MMLRVTNFLVVLIVLVGMHYPSSASGAGVPPSGFEILILNPSFEDPPLDDHYDNDNKWISDIPGWGYFSSEGIYNPSDTHYPGASDQNPDLDTPIPDGKNVAFIEYLAETPVIFQDLTENLIADTSYTLSAYFGNRLDR